MQEAQLVMISPVLFVLNARVDTGMEAHKRGQLDVIAWHGAECDRVLAGHS